MQRPMPHRHSKAFGAGTTWECGEVGCQGLGEELSRIGGEAHVKLESLWQCCILDVDVVVTCSFMVQA